MNAYEEELHEVLKQQFESGLIRELGDSSGFFQQLSRAFPARGSKIDWSRVPGAVVRAEYNQSLQTEMFSAFFDEMCTRFNLTGDVLYIGDSATDFCLKASINTMRNALPNLIAIPQHHYLIGPEYSWCIVFTFEGDMGFGFKDIN